MRRAFGRAARPAALALLLALPALGCVTDTVRTHTPRTATEQLLISESAERAVGQLALDDLAGRAVALELTGVAAGEEFADDLPYVRAALEDRVRAAGARVVEPEDADRVLSVRVAALGTTQQSTSFGLPAIPLIVGTTPEIVIYRSIRQHGYTKLRASERESDGLQQGPAQDTMARTRFREWRVLFITIRGTRDVYPKGMGPS